MTAKELEQAIKDLLSQTGLTDAAWAQSLLKSAQSKNIDVAEWNAFVYKVAEVSATAETLRRVANLISEFYPDIATGTDENNKSIVGSVQNESSKATDEYAIALGKGLIASSEAQAAFGAYNAEDANALFMVGNGKFEDGEAQRSNAFWVDGSGAVHAKSNSNQDTALIRRKEYAELKQTVNSNSNKIDTNTAAIATLEPALLHPTRGLSYLYSTLDNGYVCDTTAEYEPRSYVVVARSGNGYTSVKKIETGAFRNDTKLEEIVLPNELESIGADAFYGCTSLKRINLPNTLTHIGHSAFEGCSALEYIYIPSSVKTIDQDAFKGCSKLTIVLSRNDVLSNENSWNPSNRPVESAVTDFVKYGTGRNLSLHSPKNLVLTESYSHAEVGDNRRVAFVDTNNATLNTVEIPTQYNHKPVVSISSYAFDSNTNLHRLVTHDGLFIVNHYAFYSCTNLHTVIFANSIRKLEYFSFSNCTSLKNVILPNNLEFLGKGVFKDAPLTGTITIPRTCTHIGGNDYTADDGIFYSGGYVFTSEDISTIVFEDTPEHIHAKSFTGCNCDIYVPWKEGEVTGAPWGTSGTVHYDSLSVDQVKVVQETGTNKTSVMSQKAVTDELDKKLTQVSTKNSYFRVYGVNANGYQEVAQARSDNANGIMMRDADGQTCVGAPKSGESAINAYALKRHLTRYSSLYPSKEEAGVEVHNKLKFMTPTNDSYFALIGDHSADDGNNGTTAGNNPKVEFDANYAVYIPSTVPNAQYSGDGYTRVPVDLPVNSIRQNAFAQNQTVKSVVIQEGVSRIEANAFNGCRSLTSIVLADTIKMIDNNAFNNVGKPDHNTVGAKIPVKLPRALEWICQQAFNNVNVCGSIVFPNRCLYIGGVPNDLTGGKQGKVFTSSNITQIVFEGTPKYIHKDAFLGCTCDIYVPWKEGEVTGAPWGTSGTVRYTNYPAHVKNRLDDLEARLDAIDAKESYKKIAVSATLESDGNTVDSSYENGTTLGKLTLSWNATKIPTRVTVKYDDSTETLTASQNGTYTFPSTKTIYTDFTWELTVYENDYKGTEVSADATGDVKFYDGFYYGTFKKDTLSTFSLASVDVSSGRALNNSLHNVSFYANLGSDKYLYFCVPSSYIKTSDPELAFGFKYGNLGIEQPTHMSTGTLTTRSGSTVNYHLFRNSQPGIGAYTFNIDPLD